jgi:hypothetical protein
MVLVVGRNASVSILHVMRQRRNGDSGRKLPTFLRDFGQAFILVQHVPLERREL